MKQKEIIEGNKLIAEFDGYVKGNDDKWWKDNFPIQPDDERYNTQWNWLMPILQKIEQLGYHTRICFDDFGSWMQIHYGLSVADTDETKALNQHGTKIENTFKSVVEFIKWYNKNGKPSRKK